MMSHVKVRLSITYYILLAKFGEFLIVLHHLKLTIGFQQQLVLTSPSWLVSIAVSLSQHLAE